MRQQRKEELVEWGESALQHLRGPVLTEVRAKLAKWRDPRARLLRKRKRAKVTTTTGAATTGMFGAGSVATFSPQLFGHPVTDEAVSSMLTTSGTGLTVLAAATGAGTVAAAMRHRRLKRIPLPAAPPEPVNLPPSDSRAREPMRRLRDAEQSLHTTLAQLTDAGIDASGDSVSGTRKTADDAAAALRQLATKLRAVESAIPHAPEADREGLRSDVRRLGQELDDGVDGYGGLVAAASRAVAASGAPEQKHLLQDATDRLAGLASAWREFPGGSSPHADTGRPESG